MRISFLGDLNSVDVEKFRNSRIYLRSQWSHRYTTNSIEYNKNYNQNNFEDTSLIVWKNGTPIIWIPSYSNGSTFSYFDNPIEVFHDDCQATSLAEGYRNLFAFFREFLKVKNYQWIEFYENSYFLSEFFDQVMASRNVLVGTIDLRAEVSTIRTYLRRRYKSYINWGKRELEIKVVDSKNYDSSSIAEFKNFHHKIAERKTRSDETWQIQAKMIQEGDAFIVFGYYGKILASASLFLMGSREVYYGVGAYDRELMEQNIPVSHYPIFVGIEESKKLLREVMVLGDIGNEQPTEKETQIARFKRGFVSQCAVQKSFKAEL